MNPSNYYNPPAKRVDNNIWESFRGCWEGVLGQVRAAAAREEAAALQQLSDQCAAEQSAALRDLREKPEAERHEGVRLCGECSVGHCPECGTQLVPHLPAAAAAAAAAEDGGAGVSGPANHPLMYFSEVANGSVLLDVQDNRLAVTNLRSDGTVTDRMTLLKGTGLVVGAPDGGEDLGANDPLTIEWAMDDGNTDIIVMQNDISWETILHEMTHDREDVC